MENILARLWSLWLIFRNPQERDARWLLWRARRGNLTAFDLLIQKYQSALGALCLYMLGRVDLAARVGFFTFLSVFTRLREIPLGIGFDRWLFQQALVQTKKVNADLRKFPYEEALRRLEEDSHKLLGEEFCAVSEINFFQHDESHFQPSLRLFCQLDEEHRAVMTLRQVLRLDNVAIAEIMQTSAGTVQFRLNNAQMKLKDLLREEVEAESRVMQNGR